MSALPIPRSLRAAVALLAIAPALGCSSRPAVLARAGGETITVQDFQDAARGAVGRYPGTPSEAKATLLQDLVGRALLVHAARQRPYIQHEAFDQFRGQIMSQTISQAVIQQLVPEVPVSSAEVAVFEDWQHQFAHAHLIYTPTIQLARAAMAELKKGVPFADVSNRYGIPGMVPPGGDLGFLQNGTMVEPLNAQLREAPLNQPVGPLPAPGEGWFILLVTERRREPKQVEMGPTMYERMIKGRKLRGIL